MAGPGPDFNECATRQLNCQDRIHKRIDTLVEKLDDQGKVLVRIDERVAMLKVNTGAHSSVVGGDKWSPTKIATIAVVVATAIATAIVAAVKVLNA